VPDPRRLRRACDTQPRRAWNRSRRVVLALSAAVALAAGCGGSDGATAARKPPIARSRAAATTAPTGSSHDQYAQNGFTCDACHPCGTKSPTGHTAAWMDQTSTGFHAFAADSGIASCQTCHGAALDGVGGTVSVSCAQCHGATWKTSCTMCHGGTDNQTGAPPRTIWGQSGDAVRVGAHTAHVGATHALSQALDCGVCHVKPTDALSPGHLDGVTATVTFSGLATQTLATAPTWDRTGGTCASTYCHGATLAGGTAKSPVWTTLDGTQRACNACHGAPPPNPYHTRGDLSCSACHPAGYSATTVAQATHVDGKLDYAVTCTSCHGNPTGTGTVAAAPPTGTHAETATTTLAVGAHQTHLQGNAIAGPVACTECHTVPTSVLHANGTVDLTFGQLSTTGGLAPVWNRAAATCASTYCHGATLTVGGGSVTVPTWTKVDGTQAACGTCHGAPPPAPHVQNAACGNCHPGYTAASVNLATHIDGKVDVVAMTCTSCHGSSANPAPPVGTQGQTATTTIAVGAHQQHLAGGKVGKAVACSECHVVPTSMSHATGTVAVTWGALATTGGATPKWDRTSGTCSNVYCHGQFVGGNLLDAPSWTVVDGSQDVCGSCHGTPPAAPHVQNAACGSCHPGYTATSVNVATHIDGKVDVVALTCTTCHGDGTRTASSGADANETAAPPADSKGNTAVTARGVGVHVAHVNQSTYRSAPIACSECHFNVVPTTMTHANGTVQFAFGALATNASWGGVTPTPAWNGTTCASTYCHGAFKNGVSATMTWTQPGALGCTSCHGAPPTGNGHPSNASCGNCHSGYTSTTVNKALHMNGALDVNPMTCSSCHGDATRTAISGADANETAAPPADSKGNTAVTARGVGVHVAHVNQSTYRSAPIACSECHFNVVPTTMTHANGTVQFAFGALATNASWGGVTPSPAWNGTTCASTYCHGAFKNGATATMTWAQPGALSCTSCHGAPPTANGHPSNPSCGNCHTGYTSTTVNKALHMNGALDVNPMTCSSCHGDATRTAIAGADANETAAPPADSKGNTATTARGVGVHVAHVNQSTYRSAPIACSECHYNAVPTSTSHSDGVVQFAFGTLAKNATWGGVTPAPAWNGTTCASTYCHGAFKNGVAATMTWTAAGALSCTACHGSPPGGNHPTNSSCGNCHTGYTSTTVNKTLHMNGALDVTLTCTSCHGTAGQTATAASPLYAAPPVDSLGAATGIRVGAHQKHLSGGSATQTYSNGFACKTCHASVGTYTTSHANGVADVGFTGATPSSMAIGTYTPRSGTTAGSCASTWCHAVKDSTGTSSGGTTQTQSWSASITACTACHGVPPPTGRHTMSEHTSQGCGACHASYSSTAVNKALHVNGVRDVGGSGTRINSWNASTRTCSPACHGQETW